MLTRFLQSIRRHPLLNFYLITFSMSWFFIILAYGVFKNSMFLAWVGMFFPSLTALFITGVCDGKSGLERLLSRLYHWRVPWKWYLAIFGLPISLIGGTILIHDGPTALIIWLATLPSLSPFLVGMTFLMAVMTAGEEIGWRGFALPHLQARFSPLVSSIILGFLWGIWHIPVALDPTYVLNRMFLPLSSFLSPSPVSVYQFFIPGSGTITGAVFCSCACFTPLTIQSSPWQRRFILTSSTNTGTT